VARPCQFTGYSGPPRRDLQMLTIKRTPQAHCQGGRRYRDRRGGREDVGIKDLHGDGLFKVCQGLSSVEELMRMRPPPERDARYGDCEEVLAPPKRRSSRSRRKRPRVLAVETNPFIRICWEGPVQSQYEVILATDGEEALAKVFRDLPDLIITPTWSCPSSMRLEPGEELKGHLQTSIIPVILLTSKDEVESEVEGLGGRCRRLHPKPIVTNRLSGKDQPDHVHLRPDPVVRAGRGDGRQGCLLFKAAWSRH